MCISVVIIFNQCTDIRTSKVNFPKNRWYQSNVLTHNFTSSASQESYNIYINISYVYGFQFSEIPLALYITNPLHQIEKIPFTLRLIDENNNELGDCVGDYCDLQVVLKENYQFTEKGNYKIQVLNKFDNNYLPNILSAAIKVRQ